jgi:hypothetical protein
MEIMTQEKGRDTDTHAAIDFQIGFVQCQVAWGLGRGDGRLFGGMRVELTHAICRHLLIFL